MSEEATYWRMEAEKMAPMKRLSDEELLESLNWHFQVGCLSLLGYQLTEHKAKGSCRECRERAEVQAESLALARA